jgi:hypothetical protein
MVKSHGGLQDIILKADAEKRLNDDIDKDH